jgi:hypothetical protein
VIDTTSEHVELVFFVGPRCGRRRQRLGSVERLPDASYLRPVDSEGSLLSASWESRGNSGVARQPGSRRARARRVDPRTAGIPTRAGSRSR